MVMEAPFDVAYASLLNCFGMFGFKRMFFPHGDCRLIYVGTDSKVSSRPSPSQLRTLAESPKLKETPESVLLTLKVVRLLETNLIGRKRSDHA